MPVVILGGVEVNVVMLVLGDVTLNVVKKCCVFIAMLSAFNQNVVMLSVMAPLKMIHKGKACHCILLYKCALVKDNSQTSNNKMPLFKTYM